MRITLADESDGTDEAWILRRDRAEFGTARGPHHDSVWWVADGSARNGYAGAYVDTDGDLRLERCWIAPAYRGQRLQLAFLRAREAWGRRRGCLWARTYTSVENTRSESWLARAGYFPTKAWNNGPRAGGCYLRWVRPLRRGLGSAPPRLFGPAS